MKRTIIGLKSYFWLYLLDFSMSSSYQSENEIVFNLHLKFVTKTPGKEQKIHRDFWALHQVTRASIHGCMSTETTSVSLEIINISRFLHFLTEDTILVQLQKEKLKRRGIQKNTEGGGYPLSF